MSQDHYFSVEPAIRSRPLTARLKLPDATLELVTDRGVFAYGRVDRGTDLLLRTIPPPPRTGALLDLGCGYGAIAVTLAIRAPGSAVWALDANRRALDLTRRNAAASGAINVIVAEPADVPVDLRFAAVYSNPPIRLGKAAVRALLSEWLARLQPDGHAHLVVQRFLGADSLAAWLVSSGFAVERRRSRGGYRVLDVHNARASTHHEDP